MDHQKIDTPEQQQPPVPERKAYTTPVMKDFGSVAEVTRARGGFPEYIMGS